MAYLAGHVGSGGITSVTDRWSRRLLGRLARRDVVNARDRRRRGAKQHRRGVRPHHRYRPVHLVCGDPLQEHLLFARKTAGLPYRLPCGA